MVENSGLAERVIGRWSPSDLAFVVSLLYNSEVKGGEAELTICFMACRRDLYADGWPHAAKDRFHVTLLFRGVRDLRFFGFGPVPPRLTDFDIVDISDRGWERVRYQVGDFESDGLMFFCESIRLTVAEALEESAGK